MRRAHVLTYHSGNISGNDYANNDLVALREDLAAIARLHLPILPLRAIADALIEGDFGRLPEHAVAITLDDGLDFDFVDLVHPHHGAQRSAYRTLREFTAAHRTSVHATSFVIAGPDARRQIADREMLGHQWINDGWWREAVATGLFHIGNHTWDHVSPSVETDGERGRGSSRFIDRYAAAEHQIRQARERIERLAPNPGSALLAYPYGDYSDYLVDEYLPHARAGHGTTAAFTGEPGVVTPASDRWRLPRFTCGKHWRSPEELVELLLD